MAIATPARGETLPQVLLPEIGLRTRDIALVVNDADPDSVEIARHYAQQRKLAPESVFHVSFPPGQTTMAQADFERLHEVLRAKLPASVQAFALAWTKPYRVECMSITSAFAFGFDRAYCADGCRPTRPSPYFDSASNLPFTEHGLRPAMMLAGRSVDEAKAVIDRGLRSDGRWPEGTAYLLSTGDRKRNVRAASYDFVRARLRGAYPIKRLDSNALQGAPDVAFYFTGVGQVADVATNHFVDGAIADHLTSAGGMLTDSYQTSVLEWLAAGATGSYGNTVEPCNFLDKFPAIAVVMGRYLGGETLIESYWKSVRMPGQGVFVGDPLARPFGGVRIERAGANLVLRTRALRPGGYALQRAPGLAGPFRSIGTFTVAGYGVSQVQLPATSAEVFRLLPLAAKAIR